MKIGTCPDCGHIEGRHIRSASFDEESWSGRFIYGRCDCGCTHYVVVKS